MAANGGLESVTVVESRAWFWMMERASILIHCRRRLTSSFQMIYGKIWTRQNFVSLWTAFERAR